MSGLDDQHYIDLVIGGDTNAFAVLVERYKNIVFTLALKTVKNREEAEEISQDTFVKVYKSLSRFKGESKFSTWLYRVAYNTCLDCLKKNKKDQYTMAIDADAEEQLPSLHNTLDNLEERERRQMIHNCLLMLPGEDAFLLTLYYFEEQSLKEIAKITGINTNHLKIRLYRSRKRLMAILRQHLEPEISSCYENERR